MSNLIEITVFVLNIIAKEIIIITCKEISSKYTTKF